MENEKKKLKKQQKKEVKEKTIDIKLFKRIEMIISIFIAVAFFILLFLSMGNDIYIPAALISLALLLFCISYYYFEDESKKKLVYTLFGLGVLLIIIEVVYTLMKVL